MAINLSSPGLRANWKYLTTHNALFSKNVRELVQRTPSQKIYKVSTSLAILYWCLIGLISKLCQIVLCIFLKWQNVFFKNNGALLCVRNIHGPQLKNEYLKEAIYPAIKKYKNATEEEEVNRINIYICLGKNWIGI